MIVDLNRISFSIQKSKKFMKNSLGKEIPEYIEGYGKAELYQRCLDQAK